MRLEALWEPVSLSWNIAAPLALSVLARFTFVVIEQLWYLAGAEATAIKESEES